MAIPRPKGRGPIEAITSSARTGAVLAFRDRKVAAPLKQNVARQADSLSHDIPRPKGRGPIEAMSPARQTLAGSTFRDRKVAAPLKHFVLAHTERHGIAFRDRKVAAPLKRSPRLGCLHAQACIPRPKGRGPIEA